MSPGRMIDEAMAYFQTGPKEFASLLGEQVKSNPLPVLLTGVGVAWLIASGSASRSDGAEAPATLDIDDADHDAWKTHDRLTQFELDCSPMADEPHEDWQSRLSAARASALGLERNEGEEDTSFTTRMSEAAHSARSMGAAARDRIRTSLRGAKHAGRHMIDQRQAAASGLGQRGKDLHTTNPFVTGALSVALGALIGSLIPQSSTEETLLGDIADHGLDQVARAGTAASETVASALSSEPIVAS